MATTEVYIQLMVNSIFTGAGAAVGSVLANKFMERTRLKEIDSLLEAKLLAMKKDDPPIDHAVIRKQIELEKQENAPVQQKVPKVQKK